MNNTPNKPLIVQAFASGEIKPAPPAAEQAFAPYPDGILFKYSENSKRAGTYLLHDSAGQVIALCGSVRMADILAKGATLFYQLAKQKLAEAANKTEQTPTVPV